MNIKRGLTLAVGLAAAMTLVVATPAQAYTTTSYFHASVDDWLSKNSPVIANNKGGWTGLDSAAPDTVVVDVSKQVGPNLVIYSHTVGYAAVSVVLTAPVTNAVTSCMWHYDVPTVYKQTLWCKYYAQ